MLKLLLIPVLLYVAAALAVALLQGRLLFPTGAVGRGGALPAGAQLLGLNVDGGERLAGVHIPAAEPQAERLLVVAFGGNAWNAADAAAMLHGIWPQADVVAFHYRGYAPSSGKPSSRALLADAPLIVAAARRRVPAARTLAVGFSIGSGVAASLAGRGAVDGAILVTPFDRLRNAVWLTRRVPPPFLRPVNHQ